MNERCEECPFMQNAEKVFNALAQRHYDYVDSLHLLGYADIVYIPMYEGMDYSRKLLEIREKRLYDSVDNCPGTTRLRYGALSCNNDTAKRYGSLAMRQALGIVSTE